VGIRCAEHATLTSPTSGSRSVGIVRLRTKATEFVSLDRLFTWIDMYVYRVLWCYAYGRLPGMMLPLYPFPSYFPLAASVILCCLIEPYEQRQLSRYSEWLLAGRPRGRSSSPDKVKNVRFSMSSRPAMRSTQPPIQ
jgi:hypothetical protein